MSAKLKVVSVNISEAKGVQKQPVPSAELDGRGIVGDAHAGPWHRQVSLLGTESYRIFESKVGRTLAPGEFAENLTTSGIDLTAVKVLDRFRSASVELEVTQIGKKCHGEGCAIFKEAGDCVMPKEGIFCRVLSGGTIRPDDVLEYVPRPLQIRIITLSDRAARGEYEDRSGPQIARQLKDHFETRPWGTQTENRLIADDAASLLAEFRSAQADGCDVLFTTGGTGIGPRDITPDVITPLLDKEIPGIMEYIRVKYGAKFPGALLSRSVAGVSGSMLVYTLPGSVKAVTEYVEEILRTLEHGLRMIHGIDAH